jgi:AMP-activated protein kinase-like protein
MKAQATPVALLVAAGLSLCTPRAGAQRWQVDLAGNGVKYDTAPNDTMLASASIAPLIEWNRRNLYATLSGALAAFEASQWTSQGHGDVSLLFAPARSLHLVRTELVGSADGSVHSSGYRTAGTRGELRLHVAGAATGVWFGGTVITGWTTGSTGVGTAVGPTAGVWGRRGPWSTTAVWTPFRLSGAWFQQVEGRVTASHGPVDAMGYVGWRGSGLGLSRSAWGGGSLTFWISRQAGLVLSGGSYAADLLQALPRGRYLSFGIRLSQQRPSLWAGSSSGHTLYAHEAGETELRFTVAGASRVDLVGDWTRWQPVPLERTPDGQWALRVKLTSGVHRFNLVVDGTRWIVPDGVAAVDDGFGGKISLLVVP